ncbi:MAG: hypothetical protein AABM29_04255 [Actinomycetota bacterium]
MGQGSLNFVIWWYGVFAVLGLAAWLAARSRVEIDWESVGFVFLVGIASGLVLYLTPSGVTSMHSISDLQLRFFGALGIAWLVAMRRTEASGPAAYSTLALAGFAGVNVPLLTFVASAYMVCGAQPSCAV